ncbi:MAG: hypothetical protein ACOYXB_01045 [Bacteroidota bacterium]
MAENKSRVGVLVGLVGLLTIVLLVLVYLFVDLKKDKDAISNELQTTKEEKRIERDSLERELRQIYFRYDSLQTDNDSIEYQMKMQQQKIERLLAIQADDAYKIKMYKKEMETIRAVLRSYIVQIDSLNTMNRELMAQNVELKTREKVLSSEKEKLTAEKQVLEEIKDKAVTLQAADIIMTPLDKRDKTRAKIERIAKLRIDFNLRANKLTPAGDKTIYLRILRPDGILLGSAEMLAFGYEGQTVMASASRSVTYENTDLPVSIYWTNNGDLVAGEYMVELYSEGKMIGGTTFILK